MTNWQGVSVLVTGADGFIGSHLVEHLVEMGARVRAFAWYNADNRWGWLEDVSPAVKAAIDIVPGDVRDPASVDAAVEGMQVVFHLAALISIPHSYRAPGSYLETNASGTLNLLQAARRYAVHRFIQTSTSEVYGTARRVPIDEGHPLQPQSPYAASKVAGDAMAISYHRSFDLPVVVVRPFNTFGPRQSARAVIPTIISQAVADRRVNLGASGPTRDFTFVADTVRGFVAAASADDLVGEVVNLGSGFEISIADLAGRIADLVGGEIPVRFADSERMRPAASEVERLWADARKAQKIAGWRPQVSFDEGLRRTVDWVRQRIDHFKTEAYLM